MTVKLIAPAGIAGIVQGNGTQYVIAADGTIDANVLDVTGLLKNGWALYQTRSAHLSLNSPLPADLVSISAAALATNRALTIAAQPVHARKLQIRQVITTAITAGVLTLIGVDQDGNAITEAVSLIASVTATVKSANAFAKLTSATVTGLVGGGDGTLGLGVSNDFGLPTVQGTIVNLAMVKATKITKVLGTSNTAADDVASTGTLDAVARTFAPTTAPAASGLVDFGFIYQYGTSS